MRTRQQTSLSNGMVSIFPYPFDPGMIKEPEQYNVRGLIPAPGLSQRDAAWVKTFYPPLSDNNYTKLKPFQSVPLTIMEGQQHNFTIEPEATRRGLVCPWRGRTVNLYRGSFRHRAGGDSGARSYDAGAQREDGKY